MLGSSGRHKVTNRLEFWGPLDFYNYFKTHAKIQLTLGFKKDIILLAAKLKAYKNNNRGSLQFYQDLLEVLGKVPEGKQITILQLVLSAKRPWPFRKTKAKPKLQERPIELSKKQRHLSDWLTNQFNETRQKLIPS